MTTASEIRAEREVWLPSLQTWCDEMNSAFITPLVKKLYEELFSLDRRVWARYDRCCHEGRRCLPPEYVFPTLTWRPNAYAVNHPRLKD